mmetsp:Transcript_72350/g.125443  ORF Transcript_72350/g.125443 Transcript_72350/m.125443 type:complete len:192 (+) Transcript_72350:78-653(+)
MKTSRAESPAPKAEPKAAGKGSSSPSAGTLPFSLPSADIQKDIAIAAAILISAALLYGKGPALITSAKQCWKEEGVVVFCAKLVACLLPFVGCFGAVVHLWLKTVTLIKTAIETKTKVDRVKGPLAFALSILIISFGYTSLYYATSAPSLTVWNFILTWGKTTLKASVWLQLGVVFVMFGIATWSFGKTLI